MCSNCAALTVTLQMNEMFLLTFIWPHFVTWMTKWGPGRAHMYNHTSIFEHEASWTLCLLAVWVSYWQEHRFSTFLENKEKTRKEKEGRGAYQVISSTFFFFFLQLWKQSKTSNLPFHWWWLLVLSSANILPSWSLSTLDRSKTSPGYICSLSCGRAHLSSHGRRQKGTTDLLVMS